MPDQRTTHGRCNMVVKPRGDPPVVGTAHPRRRRAPDRLDRVQGTRDADHRGAPSIVGAVGVVISAEQGGRPLGLDGGRHRHQGQVLTQVGPNVDEQRQGQVGVEVALVHLVEHDGPDARQLGVVLDPPEQQTGRDDLDTCTPTAAPVSADGVSDRLAHRLAQQLRQPPGSSAGCDAAGLRDDDPPRDDPGDRGWHQRRLAGARRCLDDRSPASANRLDESGQARSDREVGRRGEQVAQRVGHSCSVPDSHLWTRLRDTRLLTWHPTKLDLFPQGQHRLWMCARVADELRPIDALDRWRARRPPGGRRSGCRGRRRPA